MLYTLDQQVALSSQVLVVVDTVGGRKQYMSLSIHSTVTENRCSPIILTSECFILQFYGFNCYV